MGLEFKSVSRELKQKRIYTETLNVCETEHQNFKFMRAQLDGALSFSVEDGPVSVDSGLDEKCLKICETARNNNVELLLFPEYSISFSVLCKIVKEEKYQPRERMLWCLPGQAIRCDQIAEKMDILKEAGAIVIRDGLSFGKGIDREKEFINAIFYCFHGRKDEKDRIIILPQAKLCHMRDVEYSCEANGLSLGRYIYYFGKNGNTNILLSLICADVFHPDISWEKISQETSGNLIVLHPQLNSNPKQPEFSKIRNGMMRYNREALYITCNWTKKLRLNGELNKRFCSWSCIYYKHTHENNFHLWMEERKKHIETFDKSSLFSAYLEKQKTEVLYAGQEEMVQQFCLKKPLDNTEGVLAGGEVCSEPVRFVFEGHELKKKQLEFDFKHFLESLDEEYMAEIKKIMENSRFSFLMECKSRKEAEEFMDMLTAKKEYTYCIMKRGEFTMSHLPLLNQDDNEYVQNGFSEHITLAKKIEEGDLPEHIKNNFGEEAKMVLECKKGRFYNYLDEKRNRSILIARTGSRQQAKAYLDFVKSRLGVKEDDSQLPFKVCIFYKGIDNREDYYMPKVNSKITAPVRTDEGRKIGRGSNE